MKGFVRSVEVVLASLLFIGASFFILQQIYSPTLEYKMDPTTFGESLLNTLEAENLINKYLKNYDIYSLTSLISMFIHGSADFKIELQYFDVLNVTELNNTPRSNVNISFIYFFPKYFDKDSIRIFSNSTYNSNARFVWNRVPFKFQNNYSDVYNQNLYLSNINLGSSTFYNDSFIFVFGDEIVNMSLVNATTYSNVTIIINIPIFFNGSTVNGYLYYATNETVWKSTYSSLTSTLSESLFNITKYGPENSSLAEVYANIPYIKAGETLNLFLSYNIGSSEKDRYSPINPGNIAQNISVTTGEGMKLKEGSSPTYSSIWRKNVFIIERDFFYEMKMAHVKLYLWY